MRFRINIFCLLALFSFTTVMAQDMNEVRRYVKHGNKLMHSGERARAFGQYKKAYDIDSIDALVNYNLATSMFANEWKVMKPDMKRDSVMTHHFLRAGDPVVEANPLRRSMSFHNLGVLCQARANQSTEQQKVQSLQQAIEAYKQALRNNPHDDQARYNLVLCQRQLPKGSDNNQQQQQQDEKSDSLQQQQQQQQSDSLQQQQQQQQQEQQQQQANQEMIEQMLNIAEQSEKRVRENIDQRQQSGTRRRNEKNW